jgi:Ca2+-binding RTX toxin-like protein
MTRGLVVATLVSLLLVVGLAPTGAGAGATGTIQGKVKLDGVGLADVEVFLLDPATGPRHTCTNANGFYRFKNVTAGGGILMATGPAVALPCANRYFVSPDGEKLWTQYYKGHNGRVIFDPITLGAGEVLKIRFYPRVATRTPCAGLKPTKRGTNGDDVIFGTAGNDVILAKAGNDQVFGGGGSDTICGNRGRDTLEGGGSFDVIHGGSGKDILRGQSGSDFLDGGRSGSDVLKGGAGFDTCFDPDGWKKAVCESGP